MGLTLWNTKVRELQALEPGEPGHVRVYVCGPSTYDHAHIGHARSYVGYDVLRRYLEVLGYDVTYVMNFTDVEEEIGDRAREEGVDVLEFAERYIESFLHDMDALGVRRADAMPRVSEYIPEIQEAIQTLVEDGVAYEVDGNVYFDTERAPSFGELTGGPVAIQQHTVPYQEGEGNHRHAQDFALWKSLSDWGITWESPWGEGRPGWHIECTVMALDHLGPHFDVHGGGKDLIYPHHEAEAAIGHALTGETYCETFLHNGFVTMDAEKMSKSTGKYVQVRDLLERHDAEAVRAYLLSTGYREKLEFSEEDVDAWARRLRRWRRDARALLEDLDPPRPRRRSELPTLPAPLTKPAEAFLDALDRDLDTGRALPALERFLERAADAELSGSEREDAATFLATAAWTLGLLEDLLADEEPWSSR